MHRRPVIELLEKILAEFVLDPAADRNHHMPRTSLPHQREQRRIFHRPSIARRNVNKKG